MNIATVFCPCDGYSNHTLDHYSSGECTRPPMPIAWILGIFDGIANDKRHADGKLTATRLTTCPREILIQDFLPVQAFDVRKLNSSEWGTVMHAEMERRSRKYQPGAYTEVAIPAFPFGGVHLTGKLDFLSADMRTIEDYKHHGETSQKFKAKDVAPGPEVGVQFNLYRLGLERSNIVPEGHIQSMKCWDRAMTSANGPPHDIPKDVPFMSEGEILDVDVFESGYSVRDIISQYKHFVDKRAAGVAPAAIIRGLPLVGKKIWGGSKCLKYCAMKPTCDLLEGKRSPTL